MKKILISGGAGFIGSNLALKLSEKKYDVTILDNLNSQIHSNNPNNSYTYNLVKDKFKVIIGDVKNYSDWEKAIKDIDIVVHLAAETGTGQSMYEIDRYVETNIGGTSKLLEVLTKNKNSVNKLIIASSRSIYGEGKYFCSVDGIVYPDGRSEKDMSKGDFELKCPICGNILEMTATDENSKIHPSSIYGFTKFAQEQLGKIVGESLNIPVVSFRFQNVYGPGQSLKNPYTGILSIFSTRIKNGNDLNIFEDGLESRDFVYIDDITDAIILGIEKNFTGQHVFNVGSGETTTVLEIAKTLVSQYNSDVEVKISGNYRLGDIRHNLADLSSINKILGYEPKIKFNQGISNFITWVESQEVESDNYEQSILEMKNKGLFK